MNTGIKLSPDSPFTKFATENFSVEIEPNLPNLNFQPNIYHPPANVIERLKKGKKIDED